MYRNFNYSEITPAGWIKRQLEIQADGLAGQLDKIWPDVSDSAWTGGDKDGWERVPYWLDGFVHLAYLLRDEGMIARANRYLKAIMDRQKPDGWICPCREEERKSYDVWALFLICKVLGEYGAYAADRRALDYVRKAMKNLHQRMKSGETRLYDWGKFRWFEALIPLAVIKEESSEPWMDELASMLREQGADYGSFADTWKIPVFSWQMHTHIVNLSMMLKSEAELLAFGGEYKDTAQKLYNILQKYNGTAVGLITGDECLAGINPSAGTELCAVVELMYSCERLFALTGETKWADLLERIAFNALPATTTEDMWAHQYDQQANQIACIKFPGKAPWMTNGSEANMFGLEPEYGCCTANFGQGWPKLAMNIFLRSKKGIIAALPMSSRIDTIINGVKITVEAQGDYPFSDKMKYTVTAERPVEFEFALRIPAGAKAKLNGKTLSGSMAVLGNLWQGTKEFTLELSFTPKLSPRPNRMYFVERGSLVFCLPVKAEWKMMEYTRNGVERKFPYADYQLTSKSGWAFGFESDNLSFSFNKLNDIPFSESHPPAEIKAELSPVEWGFLRGYTAVAERCPGHRRAVGSPRAVTLIPYGCTKLRMTELPKIIKR